MKSETLAVTTDALDNDASHAEVAVIEAVKELADFELAYVGGGTATVLWQ